MKTEAQLARTELELRAVDSVYDQLRYLGYRPGQDSWKSYCRFIGSKLDEELSTREYLEKYPPQRPFRF